MEVRTLLHYQPAIDHKFYEVDRFFSETLSNQEREGRTRKTEEENQTKSDDLTSLLLLVASCFFLLNMKGLLTVLLASCCDRFYFLHHATACWGRFRRFFVLLLASSGGLCGSGVGYQTVESFSESLFSELLLASSSSCGHIFP